MKNLTIKKVALGLFLAGYAASSAFALDATTQSVIMGNAPTLKANSASNDHTLTVGITSDAAGNSPIGNRAAKVGDYIFIKFNLYDEDGDIDNQQIKDTLTVFVKKNGTWNQITTLSNLDASNNQQTGDGEVHFQIDSNFIGAQQIGFRILERTDFGLPYVGNWLQVNDIWAAGVTPNTKPADPNDPDANAPTDPDDGTNGNTHGPGSIENGSGHGPIVSDGVRVGIFKIDANGTVDKTVNYTAANAPALNYGEKFEAIVWDDVDNNENIDPGETDLTNSYTYKWYLDGTYENVTADPAELTGNNLSGQDNRQITLGDQSGGKNNSIYAAAYKAGAQGYHLKVEAN
ncbi:hypothetical protein A9G43_01150 [Gilliamella sp. Occ3-1]|uniref:hypothetical protein n=1 Tax=Gilliamella sp. Occ3-1 TaxID=3120253 RepID=UPI00080DAD12|nr:hypothetical protein [Gilliamella apicola]OCG69348.1 hypothetical protein A9G43_01150 [Gilliamella apicola]